MASRTVASLTAAAPSDSVFCALCINSPAYLLTRCPLPERTLYPSPTVNHAIFDYFVTWLVWLGKQMQTKYSLSPRCNAEGDLQGDGAPSG